MKIIYILLVVVILVVIVLFGANKFFVNEIPLSTFTHSSGAFSFKYPADLVVTEQDGIANISKNSLIKPLSTISVLYYPNYMEKFKTMGNEINMKLISSDVYKIYSIDYPKYPQYGVQYLIVLEDTVNPSSFVVATMIPNTSGFSQEQFYAISKSIDIDKEKMQKFVKALEAEMKIKGLEAKVKSTLASVRPAAELYYDQGNGYLNLCKPTTNSQGGKLLNEQYADLRKDIGENSILCMAKKDAYAVSIKMPSGNIMCIDSTGFSNIIPKMIEGYSCK